MCITSTVCVCPKKNKLKTAIIRRLAKRRNTGACRRAATQEISRIQTAQSTGPRNSADRYDRRSEQWWS